MPPTTRRFLSGVASFFTCVACSCDDPTPAQFPCAAVGFGVNTGPGFATNASVYAWSLIQFAAQREGVSLPGGGAYEVLFMRNAFYRPDTDVIAYDPIWLDSLNFHTSQIGGPLDAGDSVIFHEVGHMWSQKRGIAGCIGIGTVQQNWNHEFQADSFAGSIARAFGTSAEPSLVVYQVVMASWSASHPPGAQRAEVYRNAWQSETIEGFGGCSAFLSSPELGGRSHAEVVDRVELVLVDELGGSTSAEGFVVAPTPIGSDARQDANRAFPLLAQCREQVRAAGLNPYSGESDELFEELAASVELDRYLHDPWRRR